MSQEKEIKFPLSKRERTKFENDYELIFFKKPVHNISDEKLVEAVQANHSKIGSNAKNSQQQQQQQQQQLPQEGIQNEGGQDGNGEGVQGTNDANTRATEAEKVKEEKERAYQIDRFKELHGTEADESLPTDKITALNVSKENYLTASKDYFDLFGKKPLDDMTTEQILSANENEKARISEANTKKPKANTKKPKANVEEIKFNSVTEMLIQRKGEKRVINKQTFQFIKNDGWEEVVETPSELLNK